MSLAPCEVKKRKITYMTQDLSVLEKHLNEQTKVDQDGQNLESGEMLQLASFVVICHLSFISHTYYTFLVTNL